VGIFQNKPIENSFESETKRLYSKSWNDTSINNN